MARMLVFVVFALVWVVGPSRAQECDTHSKLPVPRFVSLKASEAYGRSGPSEGHPIQWVYRRAGLPLQIIAETPNWRRVRDPEGEEVWMHRSLLSGRRALWAVNPAALFARYDTGSNLVARIEPGAILTLERCRPGWCRVEAQGHRGWVESHAVWGLDRADIATDGPLEGGSEACYRSVLNPVETRTGQ